MQYPEYEPRVPKTPRPPPIIPKEERRMDEARPLGGRIPLPGGAVGWGPEGGLGSQFDLERLWNEWEALGRTRGTEFSLPWDRSKKIHVGGRAQVGSTLAGLGQALKGIPSHPGTMSGTPLGMGGQVTGLTPSLGLAMQEKYAPEFIPDPDRILTRPSFAERFQAGKQQWKEQDPVTVAMTEMEATFKEQYPNPTRAQEAQHASELARIANELPFEEGFWPGARHLVSGEFTNPMAILTGKALYGPATKLGLRGLGKLGGKAYKFLPDIGGKAIVNFYNSLLQPGLKQTEAFTGITGKTIARAEKQVASTVEVFNQPGVDPRFKAKLGHDPISYPKLPAFDESRNWVKDVFYDAAKNFKTERLVPWFKVMQDWLPNRLSRDSVNKIANAAEETNIFDGNNSSFIHFLRSDSHVQSSELRKYADELGIDFDQFIADWVEAINNIKPRNIFKTRGKEIKSRISQSVARLGKQAEELTGQSAAEVKIAKQKALTPGVDESDQPFEGVFDFLNKKYGTNKIITTPRRGMVKDPDIKYSGSRTKITMAEAYEQFMFGGRGILKHLDFIQNENYTRNQKNQVVAAYMLPDSWGNYIKGHLDIVVLGDGLRAIFAKNPKSLKSKIPGGYEIDRIEALFGTGVKDVLKRKRSTTINSMMKNFYEAFGESWIPKAVNDVSDVLNKSWLKVNPITLEDIARSELPETAGPATRTFNRELYKNWGSNTFLELLTDVFAGLKHTVAMAEYSVSMIQNIPHFAANTDIWMAAMKVSVKASFPGGEASIRQMVKSIKEDPYFTIAEKHLDLPLDEGVGLTLKRGEEAVPLGQTFISRGMRKYFPLAQVSERSTRAFIAAMRFYSFKRYVQLHKAITGKLPDDELLDAYARMAQAWGGRGPLPFADIPVGPGKGIGGKSLKGGDKQKSWTAVGDAIYNATNVLIFSLRKQTAPADILGTFFRGKQFESAGKSAQDAFVARQIYNHHMKKLASFMLLIGQTIGLIHIGNKMGTIPKDELSAVIDPLSSAFYKIRAGNTYLSFGGDLTKHLGIAYRIGMGMQKSAATGLKYEKPRWDMAKKQTEYLLSPGAGLILGYLRGEDVFGREMEFGKLGQSTFEPHTKGRGDISTITPLDLLPILGNPTSLASRLTPIVFREWKDIFDSFNRVGVDPEVARQLGVDPEELSPESLWDQIHSVGEAGIGVAGSMVGITQTYQTVQDFVGEYGLDWNTMTDKQKRVARDLFEKQQTEEGFAPRKEKPIVGDRIDKQSAVSNIMNESFTYEGPNIPKQRLKGSDWLILFKSESMEIPDQFREIVSRRFSEILNKTSSQALQEMVGEPYITESAKDVKKQQLEKWQQTQMEWRDEIYSAPLKDRGEVRTQLELKLLKDPDMPWSLKANIWTWYQMNTYNFEIPQELLAVLPDYRGSPKRNYIEAERYRTGFYDRGQKLIGDEEVIRSNPELLDDFKKKARAYIKIIESKR